MSMELLDPAHATREVAEMMRAFGQVSRDEMPKRAHTSSLQAMLMMNSKVVLDRVKAEGDSQVEQLLKAEASQDRRPQNVQSASRTCLDRSWYKLYRNAESRSARSRSSHRDGRTRARSQEGS